MNLSIIKGNQDSIKDISTRIITNICKISDSQQKEIYKLLEQIEDEFLPSINMIYRVEQINKLKLERKNRYGESKQD